MKNEPPNMVERNIMARNMRQGTLVPDYSSGRIDIRFSPEEYYGGLHCAVFLL